MDSERLPTKSHQHYSEYLLIKITKSVPTFCSDAVLTACIFHKLGNYPECLATSSVNILIQDGGRKNANSKYKVFSTEIWF